MDNVNSMLQLINLSNYSRTNSFFDNNPKKLEDFLKKHHLDGIEMMFCDAWDTSLHKKSFIHGTHLWFWNDWLDFWYGYFDVLVKQYGNIEEVKKYYGTLNKTEWIEILSGNYNLSKSANPKYMVFHISHARLCEIYSRKFYFTDEEVIEASCELVNALIKDLPHDTELLFENLWWTGLTMLNKNVIKMLFDNIDHPNCGLMLDTGHLTNTNLELKTQEEAIDYILKTVDSLGEYKQYIKGIHLHHSLTGEYVKENLNTVNLSNSDAFAYVNTVDQHLPFSTTKAKEIIDFIKPKYLVHEFTAKSFNDLETKLVSQKKALGI